MCLGEAMAFVSGSFLGGKCRSGRVGTVCGNGLRRRGVVVMGTGNSFGRLFRISTWGESHGIGVGVTVDGCPPRLEVRFAKKLEGKRKKCASMSNLITIVFDCNCKSVQL